MPEEFRFFLRTGVWILIAGIAYWLLSYEVAGSLLLFALLLGIAAVIGVGLFMARTAPAGTSGGLLGWVNRVLGFAEGASERAPLEGGPELVPTSSPWPIVTAAALVLIVLGLVLGLWLIVPGVVLLLIGGVGWLTQLDEPVA